MVAICRYYLRGECTRGKECNYRHTGRPLPLATAIRQPPFKPEHIPGTVTTSLGSMKATFGEGLVALNICDWYASQHLPKVKALESSLRVTWYTPTRPAWLRFDSKAKAEAAKDNIHSKQICGASTITKMEDSSPTSTAWTVVVLGATDKINTTHLRNALLPEVVPQRITYGDASYASESSGLAEVKERIRQETPLVIIREEERKMKHFTKLGRDFVFDGNPDLTALAKTLNGSRLLPSLEACKAQIFAEQVLHLKLSVETAVYTAKKNLFNSTASDIWLGLKVKVTAVSEDARTTIHMYASDREELVPAKKRIDELFGSVSKLWHVNLGSHATQTHRLRLPRTSDYKSAKEAIGGLKEAFGDSVVSFDETSDPPAISVKGDNALLRRVKKHLRGDKAAPKSKTIACPICLENESDDYIEIEGCKHTACRECVINHCTISPTEGTRNFPLRCFEKGCTQPLSLAQIHSLLSEEQLKPLLSESLRDSIQRHPEVFAQCPGKECSKTYRKIKMPNYRQLCDECLTSFCGRCDAEYHLGMTCEEYQTKVVAEERDTRKWMEEVGAKQCPNCKTAVQKTRYSCNNVGCTQCKVHFCWICLETATTHQGVYQHLTAKHGGYFDDEDEAMRRIVAGLDQEDEAFNFDVFAGLPFDAFAPIAEPVLQDMEGNVRRQLPPARFALPPGFRDLPRELRFGGIPQPGLERGVPDENAAPRPQRGQRQGPRPRNDAEVIGEWQGMVQPARLWMQQGFAPGVPHNNAAMVAGPHQPPPVAPQLQPQRQQDFAPGNFMQHPPPQRQQPQPRARPHPQQGPVPGPLPVGFGMPPPPQPDFLAQAERDANAAWNAPPPPGPRPHQPYRPPQERDAEARRRAGMQ